MARQAIEPEVASRRLRMSYEEWLAWAVGENRKSEWVDGEVVVFMPTTVVHALVSGFVATLLRHYAEFLGLGLVLTETVEMRLGDRSRVPDILFVKHEHRHRLTATRLNGPADLVVEVVSDDSVARDREEKFAEYAAAGVPEYWLIDARSGYQGADFYQLTDGGYQSVPLDADGRYHSAVLPGFWLRPDWLWQEPLPNSLLCLDEIAPEALDARRRRTRDGAGGA